MGSTVLGVALACLASCLFNASVALQAAEVRLVPKRHALRLSLIAALVRRPRWLAGFGLNAGALALQTAANFFAPLTAVQAADAAGLLLLLYLGSRMLGERVGAREVGAVVAIVGGIVVMTVAAPHRVVTHTGSADVLLPLLGVALVALAPLALRGVIDGGNLLVVLGAGFAFALTAFGVKLVADALDRGAWLALVVVVAALAAGALAGTLSEQTALQRRPATQVAPLIFVIELVVPIVLAVTVVGDDWGGSTPALAVALVAIASGVVALARTPQVAGLLR